MFSYKTDANDSVNPKEESKEKGIVKVLENITLENEQNNFDKAHFMVKIIAHQLDKDSSQIFTLNTSFFLNPLALQMSMIKLGSSQSLADIVIA